jgi:hypothetical protein
MFTIDGKGRRRNNREREREGGEEKEEKESIIIMVKIEERDVMKGGVMENSGLKYIFSFSYSFTYFLPNW